MFGGIEAGLQREVVGAAEGVPVGNLPLIVRFSLGTVGAGCNPTAPIVQNLDDDRKPDEDQTSSRGSAHSVVHQ